ncbi:hypothetical protein ANCCAN_02755 [Ancylostoma caninum]|uniref:Exportin-4 n=1 Tax=Ancylostoma caninum TaxID=29170 RepID=A0A368H3M3_ANCCA|nr:hypothetical protein ANCCAN_02755 [Ancylostoma caninum]
MDICVLERAAETLLGPPNLVSPESRREAEQLFHNIKQELTIETAGQVIRNTKNQCVLFQIAQMTGEIVLRDWVLLSKEQIVHTYKMLLEFVAQREDLSHYARTEFLRSVAMILKRGILDGKTGDQEELFQLIHNLLVNQHHRLQAIGGELISAITQQFSSSWRNTKFSITWDFHVRAKSEFEDTGLRRLLEMSLKTLHALASQSDILPDEFARRICDKFLEVAETTLSWNFASKIFRRVFSLCQTTNSFRPPASWKELLENDEFFTLFFQVHAKIRTDETLALRSLSCLVQLAGLSGEVMASNEFTEHYVKLYIGSLMDLFAEGPLPHEINHFCTIINRLFQYRPIQTIMRIGPELRRRFLLYLSQYIQHLTKQAMHKAIGEGEHDDHHSLALLYDSWTLLLRGRWRLELTQEEETMIDTELINGPNLEIVKCFTECVQAPPLGCRPPVLTEGDDDDDDDRVLFNDLLTPLGTMACYGVRDFMNMMIQLMREHIAEFQRMASGSADVARLPLWQEDMHWLLLIISNSVVSEDIDGTCRTEGDVFENSVALVADRGQVFNIDETDAFLSRCIEDPSIDRAQADDRIDPYLRLIGEVLAWAALEHQLVSEAVANFVSPELTRSSLLCLKRLLSAASCLVEYADADPLALPVLPQTGTFAQLIVKFVVHKVFIILKKFSGEERLCLDAVNLLTGMIEAYATSLASAPELFDHLAQLDIAALPSRTLLMKALVLIGAATNDQQLQENMSARILDPLGQRFAAICQQPPSSEVDSQLVDLIQCMDGVARASQPHSAAILFKFLSPVLESCVPLMKSRSYSQSVVAAILVLIQNITTKVSIYVDDKEDSATLYRTIVMIVDVYRSEQASRFVGMTENDEDKGSDLVLFLDILSNVLSKDILEGGEDNIATGAQVALASLEMLLSVMNESVLKLPDLAMKFFRLVLYLVEFSREALSVMSPDLLVALCQCLREGMTSQYGSEIACTSMEALTEIVSYFMVMNHPVPPLLAQQFSETIPLAFETCLENSCENTIFNEATSCLYSLICFDKVAFDRFVTGMLSSKSNEAASNKLREEFAALLPEDPKPGRRERIAFRQRMERFLNEIQGLLSYV